MSGEQIETLVHQNREEMRVVQDILRRMDKSLFGNGQPGVIQRLEEANEETRERSENGDREINKRLDAQQKWIWTVTGALLLMQFLSSSGIVSLKAFIGK